MCVFGPNDQPARLGTHTLDSFLLEVDPDTNRLVPRTLRFTQHF
jgi:hypothetical protein